MTLAELDRCVRRQVTFQLGYPLIYVEPRCNCNCKNDDLCSMGVLGLSIKTAGRNIGEKQYFSTN